MSPFGGGQKKAYNAKATWIVVKRCCLWGPRSAPGKTRRCDLLVAILAMMPPMHDPLIDKRDRSTVHYGRPESLDSLMVDQLEIASKTARFLALE